MKERLQLLQHTAVISTESADMCSKACELIGMRLKVTPDNEQFQMAITHLARAFDRISNGVPICHGMDADMFVEITTDPAFKLINTLNQDILHMMNITAPSTENSFLLCNLMSLYYAATEVA